MNSVLKSRVVSFLVYHAARAVSRTLRLRVIGEERIAVAQGQTGAGVILVTWHGRSLIPITHFRDRGYWAIISTSRDGEYQNRIFQRFGFHTVRGSTSARGAVQSALAMTRHLKRGAVLAFTPDGPRGPTRQVQPGAIFLAQKSGCPIIPVGISAAPRTLARAWDRYMIPAPFARAALIFGTPIVIPPDAKSAEELAQWAARVGVAIDALEAEADGVVGLCAGARRDAGQWRQA